MFAFVQSHPELTGVQLLLCKEWGFEPVWTMLPHPLTSPRPNRELLLATWRPDPENGFGSVSTLEAKTSDNNTTESRASSQSLQTPRGAMRSKLLERGLSSVVSTEPRMATPRPVYHPSSLEALICSTHVELAAQVLSHLNEELRSWSLEEHDGDDPLPPRHVLEASPSQLRDGFSVRSTLAASCKELGVWLQDTVRISSCSISDILHFCDCR